MLDSCGITTSVRTPQSNAMAELFVKSMTRDYIACMDKRDVPTSLSRMAPPIRAGKLMVRAPLGT